MSDELLEKLTASETHRIKRLLIVKFLSQEKLKGLSPLNHGLVKKQILWSGYLKPDNQTSTGDWSHIYLTYQLDSIITTKVTLYWVKSVDTGYLP